MVIVRFSYIQRKQTLHPSEAEDGCLAEVLKNFIMKGIVAPNC
jgi:hypothetical protein